MNLENDQLLWPPGANRKGQTDLLAEHAAIDLGVYTLVEHLNQRPHLREKLRELLLVPSAQPEVIGYRLDVLDDFLNNPALLARLEDLLPRLAHLGYLGEYPFHNFLEQVSARLGELEIYVECVGLLRAALEDPQVELHSAGLRQLREQVQALANDPAFADLAERLPELRRQASGVLSVTIGVNLDNQLRPYQATLLALNDRPFTGAKDNLLSRLFGDNLSRAEFSGIAPLHAAGEDPTSPFMPTGRKRANPLMIPLFADLDKVLRRTMEPVAGALQRYIHLKVRFLSDLEISFTFYLVGVRLVQQMRAAGLPMCRAEIAPVEAREAHLQDLYNLNLALRLQDLPPEQAQPVVTNAADFGESGRILILTGPNQGGKTTYTQAVGLAQVLFQLGFYVPCAQARISPVDHIFTHFPLEEQPSAGVGRLGEEAQRLNQIFQQATRFSLVLLNESLTTTSPGESVYLARDILRALRLFGVRAIFVTHLHELAEDLPALQAGTPGESSFASLVAGISDTSDAGAEGETGQRRNYQIRPAPPMGSSFARDIARRHGISFEQLQQVHQARAAHEE